MLAVLVLGMSFLSGCGAERLRVDYRGYEASYAESSNRQLLLNLARLNQHHPTYFFKFGPISTQYRLQGTLSGTASQISGLYTNPLNKTITGGGTTGTTLEQDPTFTFIPVSDDTIAQQLLQPIQAEHFYVLFQQGWRLDQLMRLMVNRIEYKPKLNSDSIQVIRNVPSLDNLSGYLTFLRVSALAYELQRRGHLVVTGKSHYQVLMTHMDLKTMAAKDITDANAAGLIWKESDDGKYWELGKNVMEPQFKLNNPDFSDQLNSARICPQGSPGYNNPKNSRDLLVCEIANDPDVAVLTKALSLGPTLDILEAGFVVTGGTTATSPTDQSPSGSAQFVMRSLIGAMAGAAQEEDVFQKLLDSAPQCPPNATPAMEQQLHCQDPIPPAEQAPLLTLTWKHAFKSEDDEKALTNSLVELDYLGTTYKVADIKSEDPLSQISWNRDMFRIIAQLSSEITVDLSKFPLPTVLQIRPQ